MGRPSLVYAHGGAGVAGSADLYQGHCSTIARNSGVQVYNVDYRLAPEYKCPQQALDFYSVIKYLSTQASSLDLDPARLAIGGESAGGHICLSASLLLAERGETEMVSLS